MIRRLQSVVVFLAILAIIAACGARVKTASIPGYEERGIRLIAVMPVKMTTADPKIAHLMRERVVEALYFKGYPRIRLALIDEKLAAIYNKYPDGTADIRPQSVRSLLAVDAVFYVTLNELRTSTVWLYASTNISATFELRDGKTGETVWKAQPQYMERNYDVTTQRLERTIYQVLESAVQSLVEQALQGLPDGPEAIR